MWEPKFHTHIKQACSLRLNQVTKYWLRSHTVKKKKKQTQQLIWPTEHSTPSYKGYHGYDVNKIQMTPLFRKTFPVTWQGAAVILLRLQTIATSPRRNATCIWAGHQSTVAAHDTDWQRLSQLST
jgi:hypothetical protein